MVSFKYLKSKPHNAKRIINCETKWLESKYTQEFKIKWMNDSNNDAYEWEDALKTNFPNSHCKSAIF